MRWTGILLAAFAVMAGFGAAGAQDVEGSADHPLIPRYEGSEIVRYETVGFTDYPLLTGPLEGGGVEANPESVLELEGALTRITYRAPAERSVLEVLRNYEQALAAAGFKTIFSCEEAECGGEYDFANFAERDRSMDIWGDKRSHRYLSARLTRGEGDVYVSLYVTKNASGGPSKDRSMIQLDVIELEPMQQNMVVVEATAMERDLTADGRVAIYGILFDFDSDAISPESRPQLDEVGKLLTDNPDLDVLVVGHTDAQGALDYNRDLSERRAASVVEALVGDYGVAAERLTPLGVGMAAPVASNRTEEGRALNRRVELVERPVEG